MKQPIDWRAGLIAIAIGSAFILITKALPLLAPNGFSAGAPAVYQGLVRVSRKGWADTSFESISLLKRNEMLQKVGRQEVSWMCFKPDGGPAAIRNAMAGMQFDAEGSKLAWVRFEAEPRFATSACMSRSGVRKSQGWGTHVLVTKVYSIEPVDCSWATFIFGHRRCRPGSKRFGG